MLRELENSLGISYYRSSLLEYRDLTLFTRHAWATFWAGFQFGFPALSRHHLWEVESDPRHDKSLNQLFEEGVIRFLPSVIMDLATNYICLAVATQIGVVEAASAKIALNLGTHYAITGLSRLENGIESFLLKRQ